MNLKITDRKWFLYGLVTLCALFWGMSFFGTTVALRFVAPMQLLAMRWTVSAVIFLFLIITKIIKVRLKEKPIGIALVAALIQPCLYSIFETNGIGMTNTSESSIFIATIPLMVVIVGALFFKRQVQKRTIFAIALAFVGISICFAFAPNFSIGGKWEGFLVLFGAVTAGGFYSHASSRASKYYNAMEQTFIMAIVAGIFFNAISFAMGYGFSGYKLCFENVDLLIAVIFLGVCCSAICYIILNYAILKVSPAIATNMIANGTTVVGVISGALFAGDAFGWYTVIGLSMTLAGIYISAKKTSPE